MRFGIFDFLNDIGNYNERRLGRVDAEDNNGIGVSTALTSDEGYETALLDTNGVHPVERYEDIEAAKRGHRKWIAATLELTQITELGGFGGMVEDRQITLVPFKIKVTP